MAKKKASPKKRGRPEKPLKIEGDWKNAVKRALLKGRPPTDDTKDKRPSP